MGLWGLNIVWAGTFGGFLNVLLRTGGSTSKMRIKCNTQIDCQLLIFFTHGGCQLTFYTRSPSRGPYESKLFPTGSLEPFRCLDFNFGKRISIR